VILKNQTEAAFDMYILADFSCIQMRGGVETKKSVIVFNGPSQKRLGPVLSANAGL
jgi:hypothetical protein